MDRWRRPRLETAARHSALFDRALASNFPRHVTGSGGDLTFELHEPWIPAGARPAVVGSTAALGEWDLEAAVPLFPDPYPLWRATVPHDGSAAEYKFALIEDDERTWEHDRNRSIPATGTGPVLLRDEGLRGIAPWRGFGIAVPVFSLRSENGLGVGQFSDLPAFADWAAAAGCSVIQLLPVNDTTLNHDWDDSYPYNPVSVHALHPIYIDLTAIEGGGIDAQIDMVRDALNGLRDIDFPQVMEHKTRLLQAAYRNLGEALDEDADFLRFVEDNWSWLGPYSMWCVNRDRHGSPDSRDWGKDATFDPARLEALARSGKERSAMRFHWFVQYHLHRQLRSAADYVRSIGVALKGDLPIGVAPESVDVWVQPELFHVGTQTGAPPDAFSKLGQNWGFPTYDWDAMAADDYQWWRDRFAALAEYIDVFRIDHVLGFFRIWEIPSGGHDGTTGQFRPGLPLDSDALAAALGDVDLAGMTRPSIARSDIEDRFGEHAAAVVAEFFDAAADTLRFTATADSQQAIIEGFESGSFSGLAEDERSDLLRGLLDLSADVMLHPAGDGYVPAINWRDSTHYGALDEASQEAFDELALDFFHHRHAELWEAQGRRTLPALLDATDLLACGEDLGMVPNFVPPVMNEMGLLSLEIERMPKRLGDWIADPANAPYLSVVSPGTHDTTTLRQWWAEDEAVAKRYWREALGMSGPPPAEATPEVVEAILERQLATPAMLCIVPVADLLAIDSELSRDDLVSERINDPSNRHNRWRYRMDFSAAELFANESFTAHVRRLVAESGRVRS